ncbi:MAG: hypothetical protein WDN46_05195 [Methylocella sp.]
MADPSTDGLGAALAASPNFINPAYATPAQRQQLYAYANELMKPQPVKSVAQGFGELARALVGGYTGHLADQQEQASRALDQQQLTNSVGAAYSPAGSPQPGAAPSPQANGADTLAPYREAIASNESAGSGDYAAVGPDTGNGNRAIGRYGIMASNVPQWTQEALGKQMSPQEFAADRQAQDAVFNHKFGQYLAQTGNPQDAASMWFTGKPQAQAGDVQDSLGTTAPAYVQKFNSALGSAPAAQAISGAIRLAGPVPTPNTSPRPMPAAAPPAAPVGGAQPPVSAGAIGAVLANPNIDPGVKHQLLETIAPRPMTDALGNTGISYQNQAPGAPIFRAGVLSHVGPDGTVPTVLGGSEQNPTNKIAVPTVPGAPSGIPAPGSDSVGSAILGPNSAVGSIVRQGQANAAQGANTLAKQGAASARYQAAQEAGPQLMAASYPLRQLQAIIAKNGGLLPSGEGSEQLMHGLSVVNMLGTLMGHPVADADSNLPTLELLKKYGMQAAQAQAQSLGLHTNLGLESAEITSPNPALRPGQRPSYR